MLFYISTGCAPSKCPKSGKFAFVVRHVESDEAAVALVTPSYSELFRAQYIRY
jgi:hypothetical protein